MAAAKSAKVWKSGYDEATADRVRAALAAAGHEPVEKKMFGGLCFMVDGKMVCCLTHGSLLARVGKEGYEDALAEAHVRPMTFTGPVMVGWVAVEPAGFATATALSKWLTRGLRVGAATPATKKKKTSAKRARP